MIPPEAAGRALVQRDYLGATRKPRLLEGLMLLPLVQSTLRHRGRRPRADQIALVQGRPRGVEGTSGNVASSLQNGSRARRDTAS